MYTVSPAFGARASCPDMCLDTMRNIVFPAQQVNGQRRCGARGVLCAAQLQRQGNSAAIRRRYKIGFCEIPAIPILSGVTVYFLCILCRPIWFGALASGHARILCLRAAQGYGVCE